MRLLRSPARIWTAILGGVILALTLALAARFLIPLTPLATAPALTSTEPPDGAAEVRPRAPITLRFSTPMNRASVEAALRIDPPTPGTVSWSPEATALTFQPAETLIPAVTYTVRLASTALGRWWRPMAAPASVSFSTATQPAVVAALPATTSVPADTALAVVFSQPMVPPEDVGRAVAVADLRLVPEAPAGASWADQHTLVIRPTAPLAPATRYTATVGPGLSDLRGVELGQPFSWSFTTAWPALVDRAPASGARWVGPQTPLVLRLAAPVAPDLLRRSLRLSPPVEGDLVAEVVDATQVVTFTPRTGWAYGTTYSVALAESPSSGLGPSPELEWQFSVEPQPRLVAFFPGQGQLLPPGEAISLVFSTPMDEAALRAGLRIEPPVAELPISVNETEVRLRPELRPSTLYTITLAADMRNRNGQPLGAEALIRLRTAPTRPALDAPEALAGLITLPLGRPAEVTLASTNLTALDLSLYPLDQAALLRGLALRPAEWPAFSPERYGLAQARVWRVATATALDQPGRVRVPVGLAEGEALPPGAYYLRVTSPEGPRADLILLASEARLTLRQGPGFALVWATDTAGAPLAGVPVALYGGGTALARGQTGADGVWAQALARGFADPPLLAVTEGGPPAVTRGDWQIGAPEAAVPAVRSLLFADQARYSPGEQVRVRGLARRLAVDGNLVLPAADTPCRLRLRAEGGLAAGPTALCRIEAATGALSGALALAPDLPPGAYSLVAQVGDESLALPVSVAPPEPPRFTLVAAPAGDTELLLQVSRGGLPLAGAVVSWSLRLESLGAPSPPAGFTLGPLTPAESLTLAGEAPADAEGRVVIALPQDAASAHTYRLQAGLPDEDGGVALAEGTLSSGPALVAVALPSRVVASDRRSAVRLLALDGLGRPLPGARVMVEIARAGAAGAPLLSRQVVAGPDGRAEVELVQLSPGEYEVVATAGGPPTRTGLWIYGGRFAGWRAGAGQLVLVADRDRYSPGEVASLLVAAPETAGSLLLTVERGGLLRAEVRPFQPGQLVSLPITADMAPGVVVGAVLSDGAGRRAGAVAIGVAAPPASLAVQVESPDAEALPGASVPLTVTSAVGGAPADAELLVVIAPFEGPPAEAPLAPFAPGPPRTSIVADLAPSAAPLALPTAQGQPRPAPPGYVPPIDATAGAPGLLTSRVTLPDTVGRWRVTAYGASGPNLVAAGSAVVTTSLPLAYDLVAPAALRLGDRAAVGLRLRNGSPITREVSVTMAGEGLTLDPPGAAAMRLTLGPEAGGSLAWHVAAAPGATRPRLRLAVETPGLRERQTRALEILSPAPAALAGETAVAQGAFATSLELGRRPVGPLTIAVAPGLRAALEEQAAALAALAAPSVEEQAALALIATGLAEGASAAEEVRWEQMALAALAALDEAQNEDGGWGWWPGAPSQPFVTAFALEAQATGYATPGASGTPSRQAIAYLEQAASASDASTRAYIAYVLTRLGRPAPAAAALGDVQPGPDGMAYLALALPSVQAAPLLDRLQSAAAREPASPGAFAPVTWLADEPAAMPRGRVAATAAVAQALRSHRPAAPELPGAETALLRAWGVGGWPTAFETARVAAALLDEAPAAGGGPARLRLEGAAVLGEGAPFTGVRRVTLSVDDLPARPALSVETSGPAVYLVAYSLPTEPPPSAARLSLLQELVDPASGAPLQADGLRAGQLVGLRLTAVVARPLARADLSVALPAGLTAVATAPRAPFQHAVIEAGGGAVRVGGADLTPGVYTQLVLARAVAAGSFAAPPPRLLAPYEPGQIALAPAGLRVTISE